MNVTNTPQTIKPPSGAAIPLPPSHSYQRACPGSFGERRGYTYVITFEATKPIGQVAVIKGHLEPRASSLPRRTRKKVLAPTVVVNRGFDLFVQPSSESTSSDDSDDDDV
ncbi:hypothetical protein VNI00_010344 [Paramarasmius palmivorus]|uniref:Uncharacterized protein n=1 Tax=Paramarasmius palmivorus TaxID=297713 RepID=A0AAW0CIQ2_9AGAR